MIGTCGGLWRTGVAFSTWGHTGDTFLGAQENHKSFTVGYRGKSGKVIQSSTYWILIEKGKFCWVELVMDA